MNADLWDVVIVGSGAAGLAAALVLGRSRRRVLVVDSGSPRNAPSAHMHGVLGLEGASPLEVRGRGREEASRYAVEFLADSVTAVMEQEGPTGPLTVRTAGERTVRCRMLLVASGVRDELPDLPGLAERWGTTLLHSPYCHGFEVRDQHLGLLATVPQSLHLAELARQLSDRVTVFSGALGPLPAEQVTRLAARGVAVVDGAVSAVEGASEGPLEVILADDSRHSVDSLFTSPLSAPRDAFLTGLHLERDDLPLGSFLRVDPRGATSDPRIFAAGNVVAPNATLPICSGAGAQAGIAMNALLTAQDFDQALAGGEVPEPVQAPAEVPRPDGASEENLWEQRYASRDRIWSGRPNRVLTEVVADLSPGRSLDLGCGEGADVVWLAEQGWTATGADVSPSAISRAQAAAAGRGLDEEQARFLVTDLSTMPDASFDLVTASFLHSPVRVEREDVLRRATELVAPGGHLLIVSHGSFPPWAGHRRARARHRLTAHDEVAALQLESSQWEVLICESRRREATGPIGQTASVEDAVVLLRRAR